MLCGQLHQQTVQENFTPASSVSEILLLFCKIVSNVRTDGTAQPEPWMWTPAAFAAVQREEQSEQTCL